MKASFLIIATKLNNNKEAKSPTKQTENPIVNPKPFTSPISKLADVPQVVAH